MKVYLVSQSHANIDNIIAWLRDNHVEIPLPEYAAASLLAAKRCYRSFSPELNPNLTKVRNDWLDYYQNILASGHGSVLEHTTFTFAIENVSRVLTAELNRHRAGVAISEASGRYIRYDDSIPFFMPSCIAENPAALAVFNEATRRQYEDYSRLVACYDFESMSFHQKKEVTSACRRIVGIGALTGGIWTFNLRALIHIIQLRSNPSAEEEIRQLALRLFDLLPTFYTSTANVSESGEVTFPCGKV